MPSAETLKRINEYLGTDIGLSENASGGFLAALSDLRESERALLEVTKTMSEEQVNAMTEFAKTLRGD